MLRAPWIERCDSYFTGAAGHPGGATAAPGGGGTATVVISHLVFEQQRFDRICHLRDGRIEQEAISHAPAA